MLTQKTSTFDLLTQHILSRRGGWTSYVLLTRGRHAYRIRRGAAIEAPASAGAYRTAAGADQFWFVRRWRFAEMTEADRILVWSTTEFAPHEIHFEDGNRLVRVHDDLLDPFGVVWEHRAPNQESGLRWSTPSPIHRGITIQRAMQAAAALNWSHPGRRPARLPTESEFKEIKKNPELFRFLFRRGADDRLFWSSSVPLGDARSANVLDGNNGKVYSDYHHRSRISARFVR